MNWDYKIDPPNTEEWDLAVEKYQDMGDMTLAMLFFDTANRTVAEKIRDEMIDYLVNVEMQRCL